MAAILSFFFEKQSRKVMFGYWPYKFNIITESISFANKTNVDCPQPPCPYLRENHFSYKIQGSFRSQYLTILKESLTDYLYPYFGAIYFGALVHFTMKAYRQNVMLILTASTFKGILKVRKVH